MTPVQPRAFIESYMKNTGKNVLLYGDSPIFRFSLIMAANTVRRSGTLAIIDGCNRFDVHTVIRYAQEQGLDPDTLLDRIFISRGFTCYQIEAAITRKLPQFLSRSNSRTAIVFGLLDTFYDEQAPFREVRAMVDRLLKTFERMKQNGASLLFTSTKWNVLPKERNQLFEMLKQEMDSVYYFKANDNNRAQMYVEKNKTLVLNKGK